MSASDTNRRLASLFEEMAAALELLGENPFRANADQRVARTISGLSQDLEAMVKEDEDTALSRLQELPGVGKSSAEKIIEFVESGAIAEHGELVKKVPPGLFRILEIPGLGPKTVRLMWQEQNITDIPALKKALDSGSLESLPRMGAKTIDNIRKALEFSQQAGERTPLGVAMPIAEAILEHLHDSVKGVKHLQYAGSLRRGQETIGDIDILIACTNSESAAEAFTTMPWVEQVLAKGDTKCSVRLEYHGRKVQADLRMVDAKAWGAALLYFTGSKEHNVRLRERAIKQKMRLNEYGLFRGLDERPQETGAKVVAAKTEEDIYKALGLAWIPPELREDIGELEHDVPTLIEIEDIKAELHAHTTASDGKLSIEELAECAKARGFHTIAVTDHSKSSVIANGLDEDRLKSHIEAVREVNAKLKGITVLAGSEVDILPDGALDYTDKVLKSLDIVVASPHVSLRQDPQSATKRLLKAIRNKYVHIIGHPTGRLLSSSGREGLQPDMEAIFAAAAEHNTALEVNANWRRLDLRDAHVRAALKHGCLIAIDTDAHSEQHFDFLRYGVLTARRGGLEASSCINTWSAKKLHDWLKSKR